jgi:DNA mismatch repair ATPase MutS
MEKEKAIGIKNLRLNNKIINKLNKRLYYITKEKYHQNHPDFIPKKKQKLLEYVIAERIKKRNDFMDKFKQITDS